MNLRKSRYSFEKKRNSLCKSFVKNGNKSPRYTTGNIKCSSKKLSKHSEMDKKLNLNDSLMDKTFDINLVTSTPIPREVRKRKSVKYDLDIIQLNSPDKQSRPITSTPIHKNLKQNKSGEVKPISVKDARRSLRSRKSDLISSTNEKSKKIGKIVPQNSIQPEGKRNTRSSSSGVEKLASPVFSKTARKSLRLRKSCPISNTNGKSNKSSHFSSVPSVEVLKENREKIVPQNSTQPEGKRHTRSRSSSGVEKLASPVLLKATRKSLRSRKSYQILNTNEKSNKSSRFSSVEVLKENRGKIVPQNSTRPEGKKLTRSRSLSGVEKLVSTASSKSQLKNSVYDKSNDKRKKISSALSDSNSSKHGFRNCVIMLRKCAYVDKGKKQPSPLKNSKSNKSCVGTKKTSFSVEVPQYSQDSLSELYTETSKSSSSRFSSRLRKQNLSKNTSDSGLPFDNNSLSRSQNTTKSPEGLSGLNSNNVRSSRYNSSRRGRPTKKGANKSSSQRSETVPPQLSSRETSTKKRKLAKNVLRENNAVVHDLNEVYDFSSKKQKSAKDSQSTYLSLLENATIDDLAPPSGRRSAKRKTKSDGFKTPRPTTLKRKKDAFAAFKTANSDYEDDLYELESNKFDLIKDLIMVDVSDSETSFAVATPKFPSTPLLRCEKTPKYKDIISAAEYAERRKAAIEYNHARKLKRRRRQKPETPVVAVNKELEFSQALENAERFQKSIDSLNEEDSDQDSYFSS